MRGVGARGGTGTSEFQVKFPRYVSCFFLSFLEDGGGSGAGGGGDDDRPYSQRKHMQVARHAARSTILEDSDTRQIQEGAELPKRPSQCMSQKVHFSVT